MSFRNNLLSMIFLPSLLLVGCGGSEEFNVGGGDGNLSGGGSSGNGGGSGGQIGGGEPGGGSENTSTVSYLPLAVLEKYKEYGGDNYPQDRLFQPDAQWPLIPIHIINPVSAANLTPVTNAVASDYVLTIDDEKIDPLESFPVLQKILGMPVQLKTALVFDTSNSMNITIDQYTALKDEAKAYIDKVQAHANPIINQQKFIVWEFDEEANNISGSFSNNAVAVKAAIDGINKNIGSSTNLHKAIVKVIGRYKDDAAVPPIDFDTDGPNQGLLDQNNSSDHDDDLVDEVKNDGAFLTQVVVFSSGADTKREFELEKMERAITSQGFLTYEPVDPTTANSDTSVDNFTNKPLFYYVVGGSSEGDTYKALSDLAEATVSLTTTADVYSFSDDLIERQLIAIDKRIDLDNQYIYRYAFLPRQGDHTAVFASQTSNNNYNLTVDYPANYFIDNLLTGLGTPYNVLPSLVEITGPNGEFLSASTASLAEVSTFRPATRWTNEEYNELDDYTWTLASGVGVLNPDGSYTVNSIVDDPTILSVRNDETGQTAFIELTN